MIKFQTKLDANTFLIEIMQLDRIGVVDENYQPSIEEMGTFIKARGSIIRKLKNSKRSSSAKKGWRQNRTKMMKGIKAFHKSVDGKRFHKKLGRFLATRILRPKNKTAEEAFDSLLVKQGWLKALNSAKQHFFAQLEYFHQVEAQAELETLIIDHAIPLFRSIEEKVLNDEELDGDESTFILDIIRESSFLGCVSDITKVEFAEIQKLWESITNDILADEDFKINSLNKLKEELKNGKIK